MTQLGFFLFLLICSCCQGLRLGQRRVSTRSARILDVEKRLIEIVEVLEGRGVQENKDKTEVYREIETSIAEREKSTATVKDYNPITADIDGTWRLLYTSSPGTNSPIQRTVTGLSGVSVFQVINIKDTRGSFLDGKKADVSNTVVFDGLQARLRVTALASTLGDELVVPRVKDGGILGFYPFGKSSSQPPRSAAERIDFEFREAKLESVNLSLPYPVPFRLLGDEAKGWLDQTYVSKDFRICRGNKGTCFLLQKVPDVSKDRSAAIATAPASALIDSDGSSKSSSTKRLPFGSLSRANSRKRRVVVIFPQQLGSEGDYLALSDSLKEYLPGNSQIVTVPLTRLDWPIGLVPSFFSKEYRDGTLTPGKALRFYLEKANKAVQEATRAVLAEEENADVEISVVAHSIGGWIARAWLSEWADPDTRSRVKSVVTLGSPHNEPPEGSLVAKFDQTRGLLRYINKNYPGAHQPGVKYVSVISESVQGVSGSNLNLAGILAAGSYTALAGDTRAVGDGIIPVAAATLEGATNIVLGGGDSAIGPVYHSNFIGPLRAASLPWYGSPSIMRQWVDQV